MYNVCMAAGYKEDKTPHLDPIWERTALLQEIGDAFTENQEAISLAAGDNGDLLELLGGKVVPTEEELANPYCVNMRLTVVRLFSPELGDIVHCYRYGGNRARVEIGMNPSPELLGALDVRQARIDSLLRRDIRRTQFTRVLSGLAISRAFESEGYITGMTGGHLIDFYAAGD